MVMMMTNEHIPEYTCIHEEQIQAHSRKIERLEARSEFKEQKIDQLNNKMDKLNDNFYKILEGFNSLKLESNLDDKEIDSRISSLETKIQVQEETTRQIRENSNANFSKQIALMGVFVSILTVGVNVLFKFI